jgi:ATP-dependent DNA helicase PIF1
MNQSAGNLSLQRLEAIFERLEQIDAEKSALLKEMRSIMGIGPMQKSDVTSAETPLQPANHRKPWLPRDKAEVATLFQNGWTVPEIAEKQERTAGSIAAELVKQGLIRYEDMSPKVINLSPPAEKTKIQKTASKTISKPNQDSTPRTNPSSEAQKGADTGSPVTSDSDAPLNPILTPEFKHVFDLLENTSQNIFLTGKAGTGKSTFLKYFREHTKKKMAVVAPTGVAALNVGAQTIHSFFRLKPGTIDLKTLKAKNTRVMRNLELLIIDEISMVRADLFEAINHSLKLARRNHEPFGGVQICVIGDLFQLPPVITRDEMAAFADTYRTPFFYGTKAYEEGDFQTLQFTTIHRQQDEIFINLLNSIRNGDCTTAELEILNSRVNPRATAAPGTLVLTTTNALADGINSEKLAKLPNATKCYEGEFSGEFNISSGRLPAAQELVLKVGAQVMFVKNDTTGRWVNGTIGTVQELTKDYVAVSVGGEVHEVEPEQWETIGYEFDKEQDEIIEKTLGTYTQFPLMLAWAVTIHKSQGKTLERVIIDLGHGAFAPGQLYVALSRCKSLNGIALKQPITPTDIRCDAEVIEFMQRYNAL